MRMILRSLLILVLIAALFSACTTGKFIPEDEPTVEVVSTDIIQPSVAPPDIVPTENIQPTTVPPEVVHLGLPWADFSLRFDPNQWDIGAFDNVRPDLQALTHRTLAGCRITPNIPVGLGEGWMVEVKQITLGKLELEKRSFYQNGVLKFAGYYNFLNTNGDGAVEVHFVDSSDACIQAAEALFADTEVILP